MERSREEPLGTLAVRNLSDFLEGIDSDSRAARRIARMERSCPLLIEDEETNLPLPTEIIAALEGNDIAAKIDAMKNTIMYVLKGVTLPEKIFITIVCHIFPYEGNKLFRFILLYLEIIDKTDSTGRLLPHMFMIIQYLIKNLQHPNEYIRGITLRFLCRLSEVEIIQPLISPILSNIEHHHPYVRRNAIMAVMSIYKLPEGEQLIADAPEIIECILNGEQDPSARRNAFLMLSTCAQDRAVNYLLAHVDEVQDWPEQLQIVVLNLIQEVCKSNPAETDRYIEIIISLITSPSNAVIYECAGTLISISSAPTAIRAAIEAYCRLLPLSDITVKQVILVRFRELRSSHLTFPPLHENFIVEMMSMMLDASLGLSDADT